MPLLELLKKTTDYFQRKGLATPRLDAELLFAYALGKTRVGLYTAFDQAVTEAEQDRLRDWVRRRALGEPVAYIVGEKEFYSRPFYVTRDVLIPRPDTECLIEQVERHASELCVILDLGTGSGCIAITLALLFPNAHVDAIDCSASALAIAEKNAIRHSCRDRISFVEAEMVAYLAQCNTRYDVVVSNPPYISDAEFVTLSPEVKAFEPELALRAPEEGLFFYRQLLQAVPPVLKANGQWISEIGATQRGQIQTLFNDATLNGCTLKFYQDYSGRDRGFLLFS